MNITQKGNVYFLSGHVDERSDFKRFEFPKGPVTVDFSELTSINSYGLRNFVRWIDTHKVFPTTYVNCTEPFVSALNMLGELLQGQVKVESFELPLSCGVCGKEEKVKLQRGVDFETGKPPQNFAPQKCEKSDCAIEPNVDLDIYFAFISMMKG